MCALRCCCEANEPEDGCEVEVLSFRSAAELQMSQLGDVRMGDEADKPEDMCIVEVLICGDATERPVIQKRRV